MSTTHPNLKSLPADARTLLETPRVVETRPVGNGRYCHLGVRSSIDFIFSQYPELKNGSSLILQCSSDGMPTTKSTNDQLWPILLSFPDFKYIDPIVVGIYHGKEKPSDVDGFMDEFVSEIDDLEHNNYNYLDTVFNVEVLNYVFDSPAKALLCCVKGHAGYNSCMRCKVKGTYDTNKVIFDEFESPVRTDAEFRAKQDTDHHIRREPSPLEKIPKTNMVTDMVLDYMHLVLLGIVRKVLFLFIKGKCIARLPSRMIRLFNDKIESIKSFIPSDFSRKPRSLNDLLRWKATECRLFLLYTAPFLLQGVVSQDVMKHFLSLHVAIRILVTPSYIKNNIDFARSLLVYFVKNFKTLYGRSNMTFNLHGLLHLCDDVEKFGPLDNYSAFRYENFLQCLKKMLRKSIQPLQQVYKRIYELRNCFQRKDIPTKFSEFKEKNKNVLLPHTMTSPCYTSFKLNSSKITCKSPNNVVVLDTDFSIMVWCVVKSYEGNTTVFYTVPKSWLHEFEGQTFVFYPPVDAFKDTTKAIISQKPHSSTWKDWPSEVIQHDFGTFLDAKSVEAEVAADKAAWDRYIENGVPTEFGFGRRVIKKPKKLAEITTTEYETDSSDGVTAEKRVMPSPPKRIGNGQQSYVSNNKSSPNKVLTLSPLPSKPSYVSPREMIVSSPNKNTTKKVISPLKKNVNTPKKPADPPRNVSIPSGSQRMVLSSVLVKKPVPPTSPILGKSKPSTSKDPGAYMQAQKVTDPVDATIGKKRKSGTLDIEKWLAAHDSALENSLITDSELVLPFDTNGSGPGPRNPKAVLFMRKTDNVSVEVVGKAVGSWLSQAKKRIQNRSGESQLSKKSSKKHKKKKHLHIEELHTSQSEADE
ncbi:hypothetical protein B566_EDAN014457 [Ephemera danica]|nr:hypothetical protein B566_EDAN014457 [Ephemera danica]